MLGSTVRSFLATWAVALLTLTTALAQIPPGYYDTADTSTPAALRSSLHEIIDDHTRFPYTSTAIDTWDILEIADEDPSTPGNILDLYRNESYPAQGGGNTFYNREHSWPKSYGFPTDVVSNYPFTDCHHLFLSDDGYNSSRSNKPYRYCDAGCTEQPTVANNGQGGGSGVYPGNSNWTSGSFTQGTWETWIGRRGDVARALFYMDVRYEGGTHGVTGHPEPDLILTDNEALIDSSNTGSNESVGYMGMLSVLLQWHQEDPVDLQELQHMEAVYGFQGNRNPFVDHPEWVDCIFAGNCGPSLVEEMSGDLRQFLFNVPIPGSGSESYNPPTAQEIADWRTVIQDVALGDLEGAAATAQTLSYRVIEFHDTVTGTDHIILLEEEDGGGDPINGRGTHIFAVAPERALTIQSTHPRYDINTRYQSTDAYIDLGAQALVIAGTHRNANSAATPCTGDHRESDMAHVVDCFFQATHEEIETLFAENVAISIHGMSGDIADVVVSNGTQFDGPADSISRAIAAEFNAVLGGLGSALTAASAQDPGVNPSLIGSTNTQGRFTNGSPDPCTTSATSATDPERFIHIEQVIDLRQDPASTGPVNWDVLVTVLANVFPTGGTATGDPWINEIHYDNDSTDTGEFFEIAGPAGTSLANWSVIGYNGSGGGQYDSVALSGSIPDQQGCLGTLSFAMAGMQNGSPDGLALVDDTGAVIEFISYEGSFTATDGPANGMQSVDIGVAETASTPVGFSLQLGGTGAERADFTWQSEQADTPGSVNTGQTFDGCGGGDTTPPAAPTGLGANGDDGQVLLDWTDNSEPDLEGYNVHRATTGGGPYTQLNGSTVGLSDYIDTGVTNGTTYFYVVTAVDTSANESTDSNEASATPADTTPPAAPSGLMATAGDGQVDLDWSDNTEPDLAGYNVHRATASGGPYTQLNGSTVAASDFVDSTVTNGTTYFYVVTAVDDSSNESGISNEDSATPEAAPDTTPPAAPTGLSATAGDGQVSLDWSDNTEPDLAGYNVHRATVSGGPYTQLNGALVAASGFVDTSVTNGTTYFYVVTAVDTNSNESGTSNEDSATPDAAPDTTPPAAPTGLAATAGDGQVSLDWSDNIEPDLAGYNVLRSTTSGGPYTQINGSTVAASGYVDSTVTNGTTYFYVVTAVDNSSNESGSSNEDSATPTGGGGGDITNLTNADFATDAGTVSGSHTDTHASDGVYEALTEIESGGKPSNRHSLLSHTWTLNVAAGATHTFSVEAHHTANGEGDDFVLSYSTNGSSFTPMVTVTKTADDDTAQTFLFPEDVSGTLYVRATDTDSSQGNNGLDTLFVDHLFVLTSGSGGGDTTPPQPPTGLAASGGNGQVSLNWDDNAEGDLAGYNVLRSTTSGGPYTQVNGSLVGTSDFIDAGVTNGTTYFYVVTAVDTSTNESGNSSESSATPSAGGGTATSMFVDSIVVQTVNVGGGNKQGQAIVTVRNDQGGLVEGASVQGTFTGSFNETQSAATNASGVATITTTATAKGGVSFTFCVDSITHGTLTYEPASNNQTCASL